ncbi:nickel-dependent lactate racemase [Brevibacillus ruminantium]|uniref:Nickel-dependent lactate racemase n=1 Tax=Brevibacillus ruminantium TaxID=2950604 RepID=A0ABY4WE62_9BACL|nr:lactate racemase domain-containing protein [Brevibacillus ruminantium]USG65347.1 nickel-dependent lactate racemase [Brevibacillus ruminantium]
MSILHELVKHIPIPRMVRIQQSFPADCLTNLDEALQTELAKVESMIQPGMEIAIAVGSRGVDQIVTLTRLTVEMIKRRGGKPFIVPSMGSHGGATAEGQIAVLRHLGVTEESVGAEIRSTMEVDQIGSLPNGLPVYIDKYAAKADGIVVINRIKPHTAFRGPVESGLLKMISIGLGKQKGAEACHQLGFGHMAENVPAMARMMMEKLPILFGVGTVENAFDKVAKVVAVPAAEMEAVEVELLKEAKNLLPKIMFDQIDVLVIDEIGKNISGDGMDPNITGRYPTPFAHGGPQVNKMVVLDLTEETEGNANGIGTADFTTQRLVDKMDLEKTYANGLTSTVVAPTKIATTLADDRDAIRAAIKTCNILDFHQVKLVRIKNTLQLGEIEISEALLEQAKANPAIRVLSEPYEWEFAETGKLL